MEINIDYEKCDSLNCLECLDLCPMDVFDVEDNTVVFDVLKCVGCLACQEVCDYDAIRIIY
ncbi:MAG: hypothetical protein BZ135_00595 [Methanosphaera sp. rholeuAM6]|nr:MAG: hypothetical protein BZ135_00595 [Methanosphaera sp. rholeuAM6]